MKQASSASSAVARVVCGVVVAARVALSAQPVDLDVVRLRDNVFMIADAGAVVVEAGALQQADTVIAAIKDITTKPIRYVIDTSDDADHVGGNEKVARAGKTLFQTNNAFGEGMTNGGAAAVLAAEKVLKRMSAPTGKTPPFPTAMW